MMLTSEFAALNPSAVREAVEAAARATWREMQRQRREARNNYATGSWAHDYATERAQHEAETLRLLLAIRGGNW